MGSQRSHGNHGDTGHYFDRLKSVAEGIGFMSEECSRETVKMEKLRNLLVYYDFSYAGLTEINKDWRKSSYADSIWGATDQWFENRRVQVSQNTNETTIVQ